MHLHSFFKLSQTLLVNWPPPIAQLVDHCSTKSETMGSNPVEVLNFSFLRGRGLIFNIAEITLTAMMFISSISFISMAVKYLVSRTLLL